MEFLAHISEDGRKQSVDEHSQNAAEYASAFLKHIGLKNTAFLSGYIHDAGKRKIAFQSYLQKAIDDPGGVKRGSVNHSFAGVRWVLERWHNAAEIGFSEFTAELIAYAIGAHHGLFDCVGKADEHGFSHRILKQNIDYAEAIRNSDFTGLDDRFQAAVLEVETIFEKIVRLAGDDDSERYFYIGLLARLLLSALMDADRRDTAEFMQNERFPKEPDDLRELWKDCLANVEGRLAALPAEKVIARARQQISAQCRTFAEKPCGIYRLNVPTGGGKTLSGLRFALAHAAAWNKKRILFVAPLLTIIDQNAKEIRNYIQNDSVILEHHSNAIREDGELDFLTETWSSPIIITTLVQFLNTLFDGKTGSIRRFHSLSESVIILDEVQSVPPNMMTLFNLAINFLSGICGATVVLCSATQPNLAALEHSIRLSDPCEIVPYRAELWDVFRRTTLQNAGAFQQAEIPDFVRKVLSEADSVLVVCNRKDEAAELFRALSEGETQCFYLSAAMCSAHRRFVLDALRKALEENAERKKQGLPGKKILCTATQVIEAGVDISFERVIRYAAGMDSIVQSAGRCNRNGERETPVPVSIVTCTGEKLTHLDEIERGKKSTIAILDDFERQPQAYGNDLFSEETIRRYYQLYYAGMDEKKNDFAISKPDTTLFDLLGVNEYYSQGKNADAYLLCQAFKTAGDAFTVFDDSSTDVVVPYHGKDGANGREIIEKLIALDKEYRKDYSALKSLLQEAKPFLLSIRKYELDRLQKIGGVNTLLDGQVMVMTDGFYDNDIGFSPNNENNFREV